jgi:LPXTG-motif cell wall-anchored protein
MRLRIGIFGAITALMVAVLAPSAVLAHERLFPSSITLQRGLGTFTGSVSSSSDECLGNRTVTVYRTGPGSEAAVGSDLTSSDGSYVVSAPVMPAGTYQARVSPSVTGGYSHTHRCGKAKSKTIRLNSDGEEILGNDLTRGGNVGDDEDPEEPSGNGEEEGPLAATGSDVVPFVGIGSGLIVTGLLLLLVRRRRSHDRSGLAS